MNPVLMTQSCHSLCLSLDFVVARVLSCCFQCVVLVVRSGVYCLVFAFCFCEVSVLICDSFACDMFVTFRASYFDYLFCFGWNKFIACPCEYVPRAS